MHADANADRGRFRILKSIAYWGISLVLVTMLIRTTDFQQLSQQFSSHRFNAVRFSLGFLLCGLSVHLTLVRWRGLLRAFGVTADGHHVMRIGLFSYALNLLALGNLGGDVGRAYLITRRQPHRQHAAALSVISDRLIGLYAMFVVAAIVVLLEGLLQSGDQRLRIIAAATLIGTVCVPLTVILLACLQGCSGIRGLLFRHPRTSALAEYLTVWTTKSGPLLRAFSISVLLRISTAIGIYFLGTSLVGHAPQFRLHFAAVSLALLTGCLPLPLNGLGAMETALEFLFQILAAGSSPPGYGIAVAMVYRLFLVSVGMLGVVAIVLPQSAAVVGGRHVHSGQIVPVSAPTSDTTSGWPTGLSVQPSRLTPHFDSATTSLG